MAVKLGCSAVSCDYPDRTAAGDILQYATNAVAELGFTTVKIFLSPNYDGSSQMSTANYVGQNWDAAPYTNLVGLAGDSGFDTVFGDARFTTYFIDCWSFGLGIFDPWRVDLTTAQLAAEYTEWYNLGVFLLTNYAGKEFILQSGAESDWSLIGSFDPSSNVPPYRCERYGALMQVHQRAIEAARRDTPSTSKLTHLVEVNRVLDDFNLRTHRDILQFVNPDMVGWTIYEGLSADPTVFAANLRKGVHKIRRALGPNTRVAFSELGFPQDEVPFSSADVFALINAGISVADELGVTDLVWWQIFDNEEQSPGVPRGFGLYDRNGSSTSPGALNDAGITFQSLLLGPS